MIRNPNRNVLWIQTSPRFSALPPLWCAGTRPFLSDVAKQVASSRRDLADPQVGAAGTSAADDVVDLQRGPGIGHIGRDGTAVGLSQGRVATGKSVTITLNSGAPGRVPET